MKRRGLAALVTVFVVVLSMPGATTSSTSSALHAAAPVQASDVRSAQDDALVASRSHHRDLAETTVRHEAAVSQAVVNKPSEPTPPATGSKKPASKSGASSGGSVAVPADCNGYSGNQALGCALLSSFGFGLDQMGCLVKLWNRESGWRVNARNPSSGAYGIPQSLPGSKMASVAGDWQTNPVTQIKWGLGYIKGRYKTPCGAWAHSQATGWY